MRRALRDEEKPQAGDVVHTSVKGEPHLREIRERDVFLNGETVDWWKQGDADVLEFYRDK